MDDPDELRGDIEFGLTLKQDVKELPFFIAAFSASGPSGSRPKPIVINTLEVNGEELTWVQSGPTSGRVILPEMTPAGTKLVVRLAWTSNTILRLSPSYAYLPRQGLI